MPRTRHAVALLCALLVLIGCKPPGGQLSDAKEVSSFLFEASANPALIDDVTGLISGTEITATVPFAASRLALVASFTTTGVSVSVGGVLQVNGGTANDFSSPVSYTVSAEDGSSAEYTVTVDVDTDVEMTLVAPADGAAADDLVPLLQWDSLGAAASYEVQLAYTVAALDSASSVACGVNELDLTSALDLGTTYWRVRSLNSDGLPGQWGPAWSFSILAPRSGLLGEWLFGGDALDTSGAEHDGTVAGALLCADRFGTAQSAYSFDGSDDDVRASGLAVDSAPGGHNTVSLWMKANEYPPGGPWIPFGWNSNYVLDYVNGVFGFNTGGGDCIGIAVDARFSTWVHIVATFPNAAQTTADATLHVNGVHQDITDVGESGPGSGTATETVVIGGRGDSAYKFFGLIDDVRVYSRVLTDAEVLVLYHEGGYAR